MCQALIVMDLQNDFLCKGGYYDLKQRGVPESEFAVPALYQPYELRDTGLEPVIQQIVKTIRTARQKGWAIAYLCAAYGHGYQCQPRFVRDARSLRGRYPCKPGTWGSQPIQPILELMHDRDQPRRENEVVIEKHCLDGFIDTTLLQFLVARDIKSVQFVGVETDACLFATAITASSRFESTIFKDCVWTSTGNGAYALQIFMEAFGKVKLSTEVL